MDFKIKIGDKYFAGFHEKESNGENIGPSNKLIPGQVMTNKKGVVLSTRSIQSKISSIVEQMSFRDIPRENIVLEVVEDE